MYLAGSGRRPARREGVTPVGKGAGTRADGAAGAASVCRPGRAVRAGRALRGAGGGLRAGAGVAGRVRGGGGLRGGGGELVGAGLVGDHLRDTEADELVEGVGDGRDGSGRLGGHRRVRPRLDASVSLLTLGGVVSGGRGGLARVGRAAGRLGGGRPGVG